MTVAELIAHLQGFPADALVVQSRDAVGNGYDTTKGVSLGRYSAEDRQWGLAELTPEDEEAGYSEEDVIDGPLAVCLHP